MNTWEDTVMTLEEYNQFTKDWYGKRGIPGTWMQADALGMEYKATLEHQAEITYHSRDSEVAEARKAGIKEVVKSLSLKPIQLGHDIFLMAEIKKETWQAQLKEWGIKEE